MLLEASIATLMDLHSGYVEVERKVGGVVVLLRAFVEVVVKGEGVPGVGDDLDVDEEGEIEAGSEIIEDEVRVGTKTM